jgi:hypothetical protein
MKKLHFTNEMSERPNAGENAASAADGEMRRRQEVVLKEAVRTLRTLADRLERCCDGTGTGTGAIEPVPAFRVGDAVESRVATSEDTRLLLAWEDAQNNAREELVRKNARLEQKLEDERLASRKQLEEERSAARKHEEAAVMEMVHRKDEERGRAVGEVHVRLSVAQAHIQGSELLRSEHERQRQRLEQRCVDLEARCKESEEKREEAERSAAELQATLRNNSSLIGRVAEDELAAYVEKIYGDLFNVKSVRYKTGQLDIDLTTPDGAFHVRIDSKAHKTGVLDEKEMKKFHDDIDKIEPRPHGAILFMSGRLRDGDGDFWKTTHTRPTGEPVFVYHVAHSSKPALGRAILESYARSLAAREIEDAKRMMPGTPEIREFISVAIDLIGRFNTYVAAHRELTKMDTSTAAFMRYTLQKLRDAHTKNKHVVEMGNHVTKMRNTIPSLGSGKRILTLPPPSVVTCEMAMTVTETTSSPGDGKLVVVSDSESKVDGKGGVETKEVARAMVEEIDDDEEYEWPAPPPAPQTPTPAKRNKTPSRAPAHKRQKTSSRTPTPSHSLATPPSASIPKTPATTFASFEQLRSAQPSKTANNPGPQTSTQSQGETTPPRPNASKSPEATERL